MVTIVTEMIMSAVDYFCGVNTTASFCKFWEGFPFLGVIFNKNRTWELIWNPSLPPLMTADLMAFCF